ncbi:MAG: hypothetical protein WC755_08900 [Candidatus Woesearchaeota archaeon]|jgi:hypothetical protein
MECGREFDFNKSFFEQFAELQKLVPRMSLNNINAENSEYVNYAGDNKNCYLLYTSDFNENCCYGRWQMHCFKCFDCDFINNSEFCYDSIEIIKCNQSIGSMLCKNSSNIYFSYNLSNCHNCFGCSNLNNKEFYVFNKKVSKEDFDEFLKNADLGFYSSYQKTKIYCYQEIAKTPHKALNILNCENSLGDYLKNSKNAYLCFDSINVEDCKYSTNIQDNVKNCYDWDFVGFKSELCCEVVSSAYNLFDCQFIMNSWMGNANVEYSELCLGNENLFGCTGLRKKKNCILNKQYLKEEFLNLKEKIIKHMIKNGEYGQFFPPYLSPFAYNESVANDYLPLSKEEALARGFTWKDEDENFGYKGPIVEIPDSIKNCDENIVDKILICELTQKPYKMIKEEFKFLKENNLPIPRRSVHQRYKDRMSLKNSRNLWNRVCAKCGLQIFTTYAPEKPEVVYCEDCYLKEVF